MSEEVSVSKILELMANAQKTIELLEVENEKLKANIKKQKAYMNHQSTCDMVLPPMVRVKQTCTCGFYDLVGG